MSDRELMQQALDALEYLATQTRPVYSAEKAIEALRARLDEWERVNMHDHKEGDLGIGTKPYAAQAAIVAQQTQGRMYVDPVTGDVGIGNPNQVTLDTSGATTFSLTPIDWDASAPLVVTPHPAFKKPWVGLMDEEVRDLWSWSMTAEAERTANTQQHAFARAIEAKLKEKNSGTG